MSRKMNVINLDRNGKPIDLTKVIINEKEHPLAIAAIRRLIAK